MFNKSAPLDCCSTLNPTCPVVIVDDEPDTLRGVSLLLRRAGVEPVVAIQDSRQALTALATSGASVLLLDLNMPYVGGVELLTQVAQRHPDIPVVIMTAIQDVNTAVTCMKQGAADYLLKPLEEERLLAAVLKAREIFDLRREVNNLKGYLLGDDLRCACSFSHILTRSQKMLSIFKYLEAVTRTGEALLITGETGTGKELCAQAYHGLRHPSGPLVAVNVAGLDDHMFADTLFGHRKGAFTGADQTREGMVAKAAKGTLFLDEVGDLSESSQVKLLRLLQERKYEPLGSDVSRNAEVTVVAATNRDLKQRCQEGKFRLDLYYRLATHTIHLPPLRERGEDIPLLVDRFLAEAAQAMGRQEPPTPPPELYQLLGAYPFPGNVRELRAMVFDAVATHQRGILPLESFRRAIGNDVILPQSDQSLSRAPLSWPADSRPPTLKEAEEYLIAHALRQAKNNQGVAATLLGLTRQALNQRLSRRAALRRG